MTFKLSPSSLGLMRECERCFWLEKQGKWKRPSGIFPSLPSGMDKVLKQHFEKFARKGKLPPELCDNNHCSNMKLFDDFSKLNDWQNNRKGIQWKDEDGNILRGAVDYLLVENIKGNIVVIDYKTRGFPLKEDTTKYYQHQLDIYNFLLRKNGYFTEDYSFLLFYIPKEVLETGEVIFYTDLKKIKIDTESAEKLFKDALKILELKCPEKKCNWCIGVIN